MFEYFFPAWPALAAEIPNDSEGLTSRRRSLYSNTRSSRPNSLAAAMAWSNTIPALGFSAKTKPDLRFELRQTISRTHARTHACYARTLARYARTNSRTHARTHLSMASSLSTNRKTSRASTHSACLTGTPKKRIAVT